IPTRFLGDITIPEVDDINALYELNSGKTATILCDITTIYQNGYDLYVKDANDTYALVYGFLEAQFENGDIVKNAQANWVSRNDVKQLNPVGSTWVKSGSGAPVDPEEYMLEDLSQDDVHKYVIIKDATLVNDSTNYYTITDESMSMVLYNKYSKSVTAPTELEGKTFDVKAIVSLYKGTLQLYPLSFGDEPAGKIGDCNGDGEVDVKDVTALISYILGDTPPGFVKENANINGDPSGEIDVQDVTALINLILS
ncbi:MAG: dockerin type I repeat-containing protein, partial [Muribaculaceae bacterium]|nr:dockerin type I repeat-containing protein [Muribaculaceae bacterium]